jgi:hypothetical protein
MYADKISAKKKQSFLIKPQVLTWTSCFLKSTEGHLIIDHKKIYPKSEFKMDIKNHGKVILILQRVNFCFQNTRQSKDCIFFLNDVC